MNTMTRRSFAQAVGLAAAGAGAVRARTNPGLAVQVYSVRKLAAEDFAGTLAGIGRMGYQAVEFAGFYGKSAADVKQYLKDAGLKAASSHTGLDLLLGDKFQETVDFHKEIGCPCMVVPSMPQKYRANKAALLDTAKLFNELAAKLKAAGMKTGYHNHTMEFQPFEGETLWDIFAGATDKDVILQLDLGHCLRAGADPVAYLKKYAGRALMVHVKEFNPDDRAALPGDGKMPWKDVVSACENAGGTQWYIIEEESNAYPALTGIEKALTRFKDQLKQAKA